MRRSAFLAAALLLLALPARAEYTNVPPGLGSILSNGIGTKCLTDTSPLASFNTCPGGAGPINIKSPPYNAVGDFVADDTIAIQLAITDAGCTRAIYFPAGNYKVSTELTSVCATWFGDGEFASRITLASGAVVANLVSIGYMAGSNTVFGNSVRKLGFYCNLGCSAAAVYTRNSSQATWDYVITQQAAGVGFRSDTSTEASSPHLLNNVYKNIGSFRNTTGFRFTGEKQAFYDQLRANDNTGDGFVWDNYVFGGGNAANEEHQAGILIAETNGGSGFVFDCSERFLGTNLFSIGNSTYGMTFRTTDTTCPQANTVKINSFTARNDHLGALNTNSADVQGGTIGQMEVLGAGNAGSTAVFLAGATNMRFGLLTIGGWQGPPLTIQSGTIRGSPRESSNINFGILSLLGNGNGTANGLTVGNSSTGITIDTLVSQNSTTVGPGYEVLVNSPNANLTVGNAIVAPAAPGGLISAGNNTRFQSLNNAVWEGENGPPVLTACGAGPAITGSGRSGEITEGAGATGCVATFVQPFKNRARCTVTSQAGLGFTYVVTTTALTVTNVGALAGTKLNYECSGN